MSEVNERPPFAVPDTWRGKRMVVREQTWYPAAGTGSRGTPVVATMMQSADGKCRIQHRQYPGTTLEEQVMVTAWTREDDGYDMEAIDRRHDVQGRLYVMYDASTSQTIRYIIKQGEETVGEIHHRPPGLWHGFAWGTGRKFVTSETGKCFDEIIEAFDEQKYMDKR